MVVLVVLPLMQLTRFCAVRASAWDALAPTKVELQQSAHQLVDRMLAVTGN